MAKHKYDILTDLDIMTEMDKDVLNMYKAIDSLRIQLQEHREGQKRIDLILDNIKKRKNHGNNSQK